MKEHSPAVIFVVQSFLASEVAETGAEVPSVSSSLPSSEVATPVMFLIAPLMLSVVT